MRESVRALRLARGLTQAELAERAGVSRQLVGAVEAGRHLPRVDAAVAIARELRVSVEQLVAPEPTVVVGAVGSIPDGEPVRVARVGEQLVCVAASPTGESWSPADAVVRGGRIERLAADRPSAVVAGCDPAIGLISRLVEGDGGPGVIAATSSSAAAIDALEAGRAHAAVVHRPGPLPKPPRGVRRWRLARWHVGLAAPADLPAGWPADATAGRLTVVQREAGAGSQHAFERQVLAAGHDRIPAGPSASGHLEAATWARRAGHAAVTIEPVALALGLAFHPLEEHVSEVWAVTGHLDVAGVRRFLEEVAAARLHRRLRAIGGYDLTGCGTEVTS